MKDPITITDIIATLGLIFGLPGLVIALLTYLRDKPRIKVLLQWDLTNLQDDLEKPWGLITVTNVGRRPIYVSHAVIKLPKGLKGTHLISAMSFTGQILSEGDPPKTFPFDQKKFQEAIVEFVKKDSNLWKKLRAQISDSTGKEYLSKPVKKKPSWAK